MATIFGTPRNDFLVGTPFDDKIYGSEGHDELIGGFGDDDLYGESGDDWLEGRNGDDRLHGGSGDDVLKGGGGADLLSGGSGMDTAIYTLSSAAVRVSLLTGLGTGGDATGDTLVSIENLWGSDFGDVLQGDAGGNFIDGRSGDDFLAGGDGQDELDGGADDDTLEGGAGPDTLTGGVGTDTASYARSSAGVSVNLLTGFANGGDATGDTFSSIENLIGSTFGDQLYGDAGDNRIQGGAGADGLRGGAGADHFVYTTTSNSTLLGYDKIYDFSTIEADKIDLSAIDADRSTAIGDAFVFIGSGNFSGMAGELSFRSGFVEGDVNGDLVADIRIAVITPTLAAADFIL